MPRLDNVDTSLTLEQMVETERVEHVWEEGIYQGALVTYANPLHPSLRQIFHPFFPLMIAGEPTPRVTREYFTDHGLPVPGERPSQPN